MRGGPDWENPHAHLMFSERGNDGIARRAAQWFKLVNSSRGLVLRYHHG